MLLSFNQIKNALDRHELIRADLTKTISWGSRIIFVLKRLCGSQRCIQNYRLELMALKVTERAQCLEADQSEEFQAAHDVLTTLKNKLSRNPSSSQTLITRIETVLVQLTILQQKGVSSEFHKMWPYICEDKKDLEDKKSFTPQQIGTWILNPANATLLNSVYFVGYHNQNLKNIPEELHVFPNLNQILLHNNAIEDVKNLKHFTQAHILNLEGNQIVDVAPLNSIPLLMTLCLGKNKITGIDALKEELLAKLESLDLNDNQIKKIDTLKFCEKLRYLRLDSNPIEDITPLQYCSNLESIDLYNTNVKDFSVLKKLPKLKTVTVSKESISEVQKILEDRKDIKVFGYS